MVVYNANKYENMDFEVDTGSPISAVSEYEFKNSDCLQRLSVIKSNKRFKSYQGNNILPLGIIKVKVIHNKKVHLLELFIIKGKSEPMIGKDCFKICI